MDRKKMKALLCEGYGGVEVLRFGLVDKPIVQPDQLLIRIRATAVNSGDVAVRTLNMGFFLKVIMRLVLGWRKPKIPILGVVFSGVVEEVGNQVNKFKVGDEVFGLTGFKFQAHAEWMAISENCNLTHKPVNASFEEAAAILFGGQTAYYFLHKSRISQERGLKIMIYGATSSVGTAAVQLAKFYGAEVTAVCSDYNEKMVLNIGADRVIFYNKTDYTQTQERYHVIFDAVGKVSKKQCSPLLLPNGKFFSVGGLDYAKESLDQVLFLKEIFENGHLQPCIDRIYNFEDAIEAHRYVETGKKKGNVVIRID